MNDQAKTFDRVLSLDPKERAEGWRLHIYHEPGELTLLVEEQVLPEKVDDPRANRVIASKRLWLTSDEVQWIHDRFTELLGGDEQRTMTATLCALLDEATMLRAQAAAMRETLAALRRVLETIGCRHTLDRPCAQSGIDQRNYCDVCLALDNLKETT